MHKISFDNRLPQLPPLNTAGLKIKNEEVHLHASSKIDTGKIKKIFLRMNVFDRKIMGYGTRYCILHYIIAYK